MDEQLGAIKRHMESDSGRGRDDDVASHSAFRYNDDTHSKTSNPSIPHLPSSPLSGSNRCLKRNVPPGEGTQHASCPLASVEQETMSDDVGGHDVAAFTLRATSSEKRTVGESLSMVALYEIF